MPLVETKFQVDQQDSGLIFKFTVSSLLQSFFGFVMQLPPAIATLDDGWLLRPLLSRSSSATTSS
jgi:hypothetical protein